MMSLSARKTKKTLLSTVAPLLPVTQPLPSSDYSGFTILAFSRNATTPCSQPWNCVLPWTCETKLHTRTKLEAKLYFKFVIQVGRQKILITWQQVFLMFNLLLISSSSQSRESAVGSDCLRLDDRGVRIRLSVGSRIFFLQRHPGRFWGPHSVLSNGYRGTFYGGKAAGAWSWPLTSN
jgi:hypothetical protein